MSISTNGQWWIGTESSDIEDYLVAYADGTYPVDEFRLAKCSCGSDVFNLAADDDEGVARRTCVECKTEHFMCDSEEFWTDADPTELACIDCGSKQTNVGVGFSLHDQCDLRWLYVGVRCVRCGVLGCFAGWKVGYSPSHHLIAQI